MKKSILMLGLAVAAMTSCTNDEVLEQNQSTQKAIGFETFVNKTTRAITETEAPSANDGLKKFYVDAYYLDNTTPMPVFTALEVNDTTGGTIWWGYDPTEVKYWTANTYYFAAYAQGNDADAPLGVSVQDKKLTITNWQLDYTLAAETKTTSDEVDLVADFKKEIGSLSRTDKVDFTLKHLLSKVKFTIKNTDTKGLDLKISDLVINGVKYIGDFTADLSSADSWTLSSSCWDLDDSILSNFIPIQKTANKLAVNAVAESDVLYVMPQSLANITFSITAEFYAGQDLVYVKKFDSTAGEGISKGSVSINGHTSWEPGNYYNYTISLPSSAAPIEFGNVSVPTWTTNNIELN